MAEAPRTTWNTANIEICSDHELQIRDQKLDQELMQVLNDMATEERNATPFAGFQLAALFQMDGVNTEWLESKLKDYDDDTRHKILGLWTLFTQTTKTT